MRKNKLISKTNGEIENQKLEHLFVNHIDLNSRRIYLTQDIEPETIDLTVKALHYLQNKSTAPIKIYISSLGGDVFQMFYLYDMIRSCDSEIITIGSGAVCSAAVLLLASGDKRYCTPNTWLMAHQTHAVMYGKHDEIQAQAEAYKKQEARMWQLLSQHTKKSTSEWQAWAKRKGEIWLEADQMLEWGVVDSVLETHKPKKK